MSSSATGVGMTICFLGAILLILTQKSSQKFGDVLGIISCGLGLTYRKYSEIKYRLYAEGLFLTLVKLLKFRSFS